MSVDDFFGLKEPPFKLSPDPSFLFLSKDHARAKAYMESTIWLHDGFVVITGDIGCGKTTLIETLIRELPKDVVYAQITQTQVSATEFLQGVLAQLGFKPFRMNKANVLHALDTFIIDQYASGRRVLLIVDEAQNLSSTVLEEIRLLSTVETTKEKVLRVVLAGQRELNDKLNSPGLAQLAQRVRLRFHLGPLTESDTALYVQHRLDVAGAAGRRIFDEEAFPLIYRYTGGTPRLINSLCDTSMAAAFAAQKATVGVEEVRSAIEELQWVEIAHRPADAVAPLPGENHDEQPVRARLLIAMKGNVTTEYKLIPGRITIGRTSDNDLQLDEKFISRHHARIVTASQSCVLEDLNSTNGVYIRGKRIRRHALNDGDIIQLGNVELMYVDERH